MASPLAVHWTLEPGLAFLNHGSFGACPATVQTFQAELRRRLERQPVAFFARELPDLFDAARNRVASFVGADPEGMVAVTNASTGVATVLASLSLRPGDELLTTDHVYGACRNALGVTAERTGARVVVAHVPFPLADPGEVVAAVMGAATSRTRLALLDHVTSPTGLVFPIAELCVALRQRGVEVLVDGAHAPGMLPLQIEGLGATWYTGNLHKWVCAPKGAAFLWVAPERRQDLRPLVTSHGEATRRPGRSSLHDRFDWTGTDDPTPFLAAPVALDTIGSLLPGGWPAVMAANRALALEGRRILAAALGVSPSCPEAMIGTLAALPLPDDPDPRPPASGLYQTPLQARLVEDHGIEVPIVPWPAPPRRLVRISAQLYNEPAEYRRLGDALGRLLAEGPAAPVVQRTQRSQVP